MGRFLVGERHHSPWTNVHVDGPAAADTNAASTSPKRLFH